MKFNMMIKMKMKERHRARVVGDILGGQNKQNRREESKKRDEKGNRQHFENIEQIDGDMKRRVKNENRREG